MEFRESLANYKTALTTVTQKLIEAKTGKNVPISAIKAWGSLAIVMRFVDHYIDSNPNEAGRAEIADNVTNYLKSSNSDFRGTADGRLLTSLSSLRDELSLLPTKRRDGFKRNLGVIFKVTEAIKLTDNPKDFTDLTRLEGQTVSRLFTSFLPDEFHNQNFLCWFHRLARVGNTLDSFVDLGSDYEGQQSRIKPILPNYLRLVRGVLPDLKFLALHSNLGLVRNYFRMTFGFYKEEQPYVA